MGWELSAYSYDRKRQGGLSEKPLAVMDYGHEGEMSELLGLKDGPGKTRVAKHTLQEALCECCEQYVDDESYIDEVLFFATVLANWPHKANNVCIMLS
ncbi:hypothetical protein [Zavarzinella formosa]|uniref:hypothetical protein n=1 Tax=Zavarzinella formosa TaxID=360055 RepID=UPI0002E0B302|nr:hypothetical protein [Zavarzinella formosa]